jgi:hypothetical protein
VKRLFPLLAGAALLFGATGVQAADSSIKTAAPAAEADEPEDLSRFSIDTSLDVHSRGSVFGYGAVTFAPFDILDKSGVRVKLEGLTGGYHYNTEGDPAFFQPPLFSIHGHDVEASWLVGYEHVTDELTLAGFVGADYQRVTERYNPANTFGFLNDPTGYGGLTNPTLGTRWGVKFSTDLDYKPSEQWSINLEGNYSTANNQWWSRFRPGYAVMEDVYIGPEAGFQGNNFYREWRLGAHMRGFKVGPVELGLATGFMRDDIVGNGVYGTIETSVRF